MLRGLYAPTDFESQDQDPSVSSGEKLEAINTSQVIVQPALIKGIPCDEELSLSLPYVPAGLFGRVSMSQRESDYLFVDHIDVGDPALYGHGIGTRLMKAACRYAVDRRPKLAVLHTNWIRLGAINTAIRVFGEENVAIIHNVRYGWKGDKPLAAIFDDKPFESGKRYVVGEIEARIDPDVAITWEQPLYQLPVSNSID